MAKNIRTKIIKANTSTTNVSFANVTEASFFNYFIPESGGSNWLCHGTFLFSLLCFVVQLALPGYAELS